MLLFFQTLEFKPVLMGTGPQPFCGNSSGKTNLVNSGCGEGNNYLSKMLFLKVNRQQFMKGHIPE